MKMLDLFCGAGGSACGYAQAGFGVLGIDNDPQPNYPFDFVQADALEYLWTNASQFDVMTASPPCQSFSTLHTKTSKVYPNLITPLRLLAQRIEIPYVIENVVGAPLRAPITLCGSMFDLGTRCQDGVQRQLRRHRLFESSIPLHQPNCHHVGQPVGVYGHGGGGQMTRGYKGTMLERKQAMDIFWMTRPELSQAIPPAYTRYIGGQLMRLL